MSLTLDRLKTFVVLAETLSFQKTAEIVGRSQPAVTTQIKTLEETLGVPLFFRGTRSISISPEGKFFYSRVRHLITELDELVTDFRRVSSLEIGQLRVGATPTLAAYILPELLRNFIERYPGVKIFFADEPTAKLERLVIDREIDLYLGPKPSPSSKLNFDRVASDPYLLVVPRSHEMATRKNLPIEELSKLQLLVLKRGTMVRDEVDSFLAANHLSVSIAVEVANHYTLGGLIRAGIGLALLPQSAMPMMADDNLVGLPLEPANFFRQIGIATRSDYRPAPATKAFIRMIRPEVAKLIKHGERS